MSNEKTTISEDDKTLIENIKFQLFPQLRSESENQSLEVKDTELNEFQLFPIEEFNITSEEKEIEKFINDRYQTLLSTCYFESISVATIFSTNNGKPNIYIGLKKEGTTRNKFRSIISGILPCNQNELDINLMFSDLIKGNQYGGVISGTPILFDKKEKEKQQFKIASVLKSLKDNKFTLAIVSKPIPKRDLDVYKQSLLDFKNKLHPLTKITLNNTESDTENDSPGFFNNLLNGFRKTKDKDKTEKTTSKQNSNATTSEEINAEVVKLLESVELFIERISKGANNGFWETNISFVTEDKDNSEILAGTFLGELANNTDVEVSYFKPVIKLKESSEGMFFPTKDIINKGLFPKNLCSYITSQELSFIASFPKEAIPGYEIKRMPNLALTDVDFGVTKNCVGYITENGVESKNNTFSLSKETLNKHLFITGATGSGKSNTVKQILKNVVENDSLPFLVIESAKRDYRKLLNDEVFKELRIYTIGDSETSPIKMNPFYVQKGVKLSSHIDFLKAIFNASFSLYGPMPGILEKSLNNVYENLGWDLISGAHFNFRKISDNSFDVDKFYKDENSHYFFPTLNTLKNEIERHMNENLKFEGEYKENIKGSILNSLEGLTTGVKGLMFNTYDFHPIEELLKHPTIFEMEDLVDDDDKAFFVGLLLTLISEYRQKEAITNSTDSESKKEGLQHILVIEEAHRLLKNVSTEKSSDQMGNPKGKAVEYFGNVIAEMRSLGQGVIIAEQIPSKLAPEVIKNSNTKIAHRIAASDDQALLAGSLSITNQEAIYLNRLKTGHALCHKEGMEKPVEVKFSTDCKEAPISNEKVKEQMKNFTTRSLHSNRAYQLQAMLKDDGIQLITKFLNSLGISGEDYLEDILETFQNELEKLVHTKTNFNFSNNEDLFDYATLQIVELFRDGMYNSKGLLPNKIAQLFKSLFSLKNEDSYTDLMAELTNYYEEKFEFICLPIVEKMVNTYFQNDTNTESNVENIVYTLNDYILIEDIATEKLILNNTKDILWSQLAQQQSPSNKSPLKWFKKLLNQ
ncbi:MAG: ATP-binding protein [Gelidibacter sp.]|nr:ATP-binding protein [Gelidibacter sp.]